MNKRFLLLLIPLSLSAYTHLWNPVGFPDIFFDEGVYMRRSVNLLETGSPQEAYLYDHPYFGQILLASFFKSVGYPDSLNNDTSAESVSTLYMIPRMFMGILAVLDTFLVYKITEKKFGTNAALLSSLLFAVMPFTWVFRRILLDSLLLPFLLSSILVALYARDPNKKLLIVSSGVLLGLAIFTKVTAVTMIPLVLYLVFTSTKSLKSVAIWLIPVIAIPSMWVWYSMHLNQFDLWLEGVLWQAGRESGGIAIAKFFWDIDPVLLVLGAAGVAFAIYKKNALVLLWFAPFVTFIATVGFTQYFHWILVVPVFCIAAGAATVGLFEWLKLKDKTRPTVVACLAIVMFGLASITPLITADVSSSQFEAMSFVLNNVENTDNVTILASPVYSWVFDDVYERDYVMLDYAMILFGEKPTQKTLLVADEHFKNDIPRGRQLQEIYEQTQTVAVFSSDVTDYDTRLYPYGSMRYNFEGHNIEIKTSYNSE